MNFRLIGGCRSCKFARERRSRRQRIVRRHESRLAFAEFPSNAVYNYEVNRLPYQRNWRQSSGHVLLEFTRLWLVGVLFRVVSFSNLFLLLLDLYTTRCVLRYFVIRRNYTLLLCTGFNEISLLFSATQVSSIPRSCARTHTAQRNVLFSILTRYFLY